MVGGFDALSIGSPKSGMNSGLLKKKKKPGEYVGWQGQFWSVQKALSYPTI